jgi:hypothetical protein
MREERDNLRADSQKSPSELEREAERARYEVEHTLEALERRLSPGELLDQGLRMFRHGGDSGFGRNLADQVRNNPVPTMLTGIGLTWLMAASNRPPRHPSSSSGGLSEKASSAASAASGAASKASGAASSARDSASQAADRARAAGQQGRAMAGDAAHRASDMGRSLADASRGGAQQAWEGYEYLRREQPLVLGALAVAAGALIGGLVPTSEAENRYVGEYSDEATDRLKQEASRQAEQAKETAAGAAEAAKEEAKRQSSTTGSAGSSTAS